MSKYKIIKNPTYEDGCYSMVLSSGKKTTEVILSEKEIESLFDSIFHVKMKLTGDELEKKIQNIIEQYCIGEDGDLIFSSIYNSAKNLSTIIVEELDGIVPLIP